MPEHRGTIHSQLDGDLGIADPELYQFLDAVLVGCFTLPPCPSLNAVCIRREGCFNFLGIVTLQSTRLLELNKELRALIRGVVLRVHQLDTYVQQILSPTRSPLLIVL